MTQAKYTVHLQMFHTVISSKSKKIKQQLNKFNNNNNSNKSLDQTWPRFGLSLDSSPTALDQML